MNNIEKTLINNVGDAINLAKNQNEKYWFRGHADASWGLTPTVFRRNSEGKYYNEGKLLSEFTRMHPESKEKHHSTLELLTYAQHYGLPTRLLDWTENLLVALYFACYETTNHEIDGKLFLIKTSEANKNNVFIKMLSNEEVWDTIIRSNGTTPIQTKEEIASKIMSHFKSVRCPEHVHYFLDNKRLDLKFPDFVKNLSLREPIELKYDTGSNSPANLSEQVYLLSPQMINQRLINQSGCFTVHMGKIANGAPAMSIVDPQVSFPHMIQSFVIPSNAKPIILQELKLCGIHGASIFPELEYKTKHIRQYCTY